MDVREQILNSEILHLGQMVQIISYELTILNDFLREQFGSAYEAYRSTHHVPMLSATIPTAKRTNVELPPKTKKIKSSKVTVTTEGATQELFEERAEHEVGDFDGDGFDNEETDDNDFVDSINMSGDVADLPDGSVIIDPLEESKFCSRKRKSIWGKFIIARMPNNKLIAKCPTCLNLVSNKVERLENHYMRCTKGDAKVKISSPRRTTPRVKAGSSSSERGRTMDHVWSYFDVTENDQPGKTWKRKVVKCKRCLKEVSPKVERVRKHFMLCYEIASENDGGAETGKPHVNQSISHRSIGTENDVKME